MNITFPEYVKLVKSKKTCFNTHEMCALGFSGLVTETLEFETEPIIYEASDVLISLAYICAGMKIGEIQIMPAENPDLLYMSISILEHYKKSFYNPVDKHGLKMLISAFYVNFLASCGCFGYELNDIINVSIEKHNL